MRMLYTAQDIIYRLFLFMQMYVLFFEVFFLLLTVELV